MRKIGAEVASGIAIFLAFVIFVVGFLFLKNVAFKTDRYNVFVHFQDVTGLEPSDFVSVSGLRIGKVSGFQLEGTEVIVKIEIDPEIELPKDSQAQIKSLGLVGEKFIDIIPGSADELLEDGDHIQGKGTPDLSDMTGSLEGLAEQAEDLLKNLRTAFDNVFDQATQKDLKQGISHLNNVTYTLDKNTSHLEQTMTNLDELSTNLNQILAERRGKVENSIDNLHQAASRLDELTSKMDSSLTSVKSLLAKIENKEGALGKVIADDTLYNNVRDLTAELDALVQDLKKRPQKYLNLGFIKIF